jgi:putative DNA primase/helicase
VIEEDQPSDDWEAAEPVTDSDILAVQPRTTDAGNARAVYASCGSRYRYVVEWESWLVWLGTHWAREGADSSLFADVVLVAQREYYQSKASVVALEEELRAARKQYGMGSVEAEDAENRLKAELSLLAWHKGSQNTGKVRACIDQLHHPCGARLADLDRDPWLLNCSNGTVDLRTGELRDHARDDLITRCLPTPFDLRHKAPAWEQFLEQCMGGQRLVALYLQRLVGYSLTALSSEHMLVFCYGSGSNGKTTFLRTIQSMLGAYAVNAPRTLLFERAVGDTHPTELATLYGRRLAICAEVGEESFLDEGKVKDLTGGDKISCRRMHEDFWDFEPTHTLWLAGNHKPNIKGTDDGIWRRVRVIPWTVQFKADEQDKSLLARLATELPGILAWAVHGCLEWQRLGVLDPPEVSEATREYRQDSDVLGEFFRLHVSFEPDGRTPCKSLRTVYVKWCEEMGHMPLGARRIGQRLRSNGVKPTTLRTDGKVVDAWAGVRQLADWERPGEPGGGPKALS